MLAMVKDQKDLTLTQFFKLLVFISLFLFCCLSPTFAKEEAEILIQSGHFHDINTVAFSPDGTTIVSGSSDMRFWEHSTGRLVRTIETPGKVKYVAFSPDGTQVLSGGSTLQLWDRTTGQLVRTFEGLNGGINCVAFSPDGTEIVLGQGKTLQLWDRTTGKRVRTFDIQNIGMYQIYAVAFSPDGRQVLSGGRTLRLWNRTTGELVRTFEAPRASVTRLAFSPDGRRVLSVGGNTLRLWDRVTGELLQTLKGATHAVSGVAFNPEGTQVISGGYDQTLRLWDLSTGRVVRTFGGPIRDLSSMDISPDGAYVVSSAWHGGLQLWDRSTGVLLHTFEEPSANIVTVAFGPNSMQVVSGSSDGTVRLWNVATGQRGHIFRGHTGKVTDVAFTPDGKEVVSGGLDDTIRLWDLATGGLVSTIENTPKNEFVLKGIKSLAVSPDGSRIISGDRGGNLRLWDRMRGRLVGTIRGTRTDVYALAFSPDGRQILKASSDGTVKLVDLATRQVVHTFDSGAAAMAFSPDGTQVLLGGGKTLQLWDRTTGDLVRTFESHRGGRINAVAFSPEGTQVFSGSWDGTLRLWNPQTGELLVTLIGFQNGEWVAYTPDNYYVASPNGDQYVSFRVGNKVYDFAQYASLYQRPEILAKILRGKDIQREIARIQQETGVDLTSTSITDLLPPELVLQFLSGEGINPEPRNQTVNVPHLTLNLLAIDRVHGVSRVVVTINDQTVNEIKVEGESGKKEFPLQVPLVLNQEENVIKLVAYNSKDIRSRAQEVHVTYQKDILKGLSLPELIKHYFGKSRSWAVVIGINDYSPKTNGFEYLPYAVNDAKKVKEHLVTNLGFSNDRVLSLYNKDATKEKIEALLGDELPTKMSEEDRLFVFYSGHGATKQTNRFDPTSGEKQKIGYLVPVDGHRDKLHSTAISMNQFSAFSDLNPAQQILFVIDACYSGIAGVVRKGKEQKLAQHTRRQVETFIQSRGRQIMTAGTDRETTVMSRKWNNHSVFTYFLLHGLKGKADYNQDQVISVDELEIYLGAKVPGQAAQTPQVFDLENTQGQFVFYPEGAF
jgi:WD40 repeat protein